MAAGDECEARTRYANGDAGGGGGAAERGLAGRRTPVGGGEAVWKMGIEVVSRRGAGGGERRETLGTLARDIGRARAADLGAMVNSKERVEIRHGQNPLQA